MTGIDPAIFAAEEERLGIKFPAVGTAILAHDVRGKVIAGYVKTVWMCLDMVCIDIQTVRGVFSIYPELGQKFKAREDL